MTMEDKTKQLSDSQLSESIRLVSERGSTALEQTVLLSLLREYEDRNGSDALDQFIAESGIVPVFFDAETGGRRSDL